MLEGEILINADIIYKVDVATSAIDIWTLVISILSLAITTILSVLVYRLTQKIGNKQNELEKYDLKIQLFDKRMQLFELVSHIYSTLSVFQHELKRGNSFAPNEFVFSIKLNNSITLSKFLFSEEVSVIIKDLFNLVIDVEAQINFYKENTNQEEKAKLKEYIDEAIEYYKTSNILEKLSLFLELSFESKK